MTKTNAELELDVTEELAWDPKVDSEEIAVGADDGTVTLRGTVGSFRQKREARKAAERVYGVLYVNNELNVRILDEYRHDDADLRGDVLQALMLDSLVPNTIDAREERLFDAIDGARTIAEIARSGGSPKDAGAFFERLYQHDQVVFDASH